MRRLAFEPEPDPGRVVPDLATTVARATDDATPADELPELLRRAAELAGAAGATTATFEAEPAPAPLDALCRAAGYEPARTTVQLRRSLPLPDELARAARSSPVAGRLRPFRPGIDDDAWLGVNARAFAWHPEQGGVSADDLTAKEAEPWFRADGFLVLDRDDGEPGLAGFCWTKIHADHDPPLGEIFVIGVDPDQHGRGLGRSLVVAGLDWLAGQGLLVAMLYVEHDNESAVGLYRSLGFEEHLAHRWWRRRL